VLSIAPHGEGHFFAPDVSPSSKELLVRTRDDWRELWPKILAHIQESAQSYDVKVEFSAQDFYGTVQPLESGVFMSDKADVLIGIHPTADSVPVWHAFVRDTEVVHFQPVF
jgi:hypothetical protein